MKADGTVAHYLTDRMQSTRQMLNASGTVANTITYDGFGNVLSETDAAFGDRWKWTGRESNAYTGLQYNRARYYSGESGRWVSEDPIRFRAGDYNVARYVNNYASLCSDPSGLWRFGISFNLFGYRADISIGTGGISVGVGVTVGIGPPVGGGIYYDPDAVATPGIGVGVSAGAILPIIPPIPIGPIFLPPILGLPPIIIPPVNTPWLGMGSYVNGVWVIFPIGPVAGKPVGPGGIGVIDSVSAGIQKPGSFYLGTTGMNVSGFISITF